MVPRIDEYLGTTESKLAYAKANPTLCLFPYNTLDLRKSTNDPKRLVTTACCNLGEIFYNPDTIDDPFRSIKDSMNAGVLPSECQNCISEESNGGMSERIRGLTTEFESAVRRFGETRIPRTFELRIKFGTKCMQACRSCSPTESSLWSKFSGSTAFTHMEADITDIDEYWQLITSTVLNKLKQGTEFYLHCIGGETFVQPGMKKLLNWVIENNLQQQVGLRMTTSLSTIPDGLIEQIQQFREIDTVLSIDSTGDNYQYVRWPVQFDKIEENLLRLQQYIIDNNLPKWQLAVSPVFTLNNIFYIDQYLDYWYRHFEKYNTNFPIYPTNVTMYTQHLDIQSLPVRYRTLLKQQLTDCMSHELFGDRYRHRTGGLQHFIESTIQELDKWPEDNQLWQTYLTFSAEYDVRSNTDLAILNSRLYNILTAEDQELFLSKKQTVNTQQRMKLHFEILPTKSRELVVENIKNNAS